MPAPSEYQRATDDFYKPLMDARDAAGLTRANHQASSGPQLAMVRLFNGFRSSKIWAQQYTSFPDSNE